MHRYRASLQESGGASLFFQFLILSIFLPALFFSAIELICRAIHLPTLIEGNGKLQLEMPTWMLREANSRHKARRIEAGAREFEWLSLYEEGDDFRVRLIPEMQRQVTNTFSFLRNDTARKYTIVANSLGFRGDRISSERPPGTLRILVFGDSSSFGWGVEYTQSYSAVLERILEERTGRPVEVGNFAMPGDSSEYGRLIFDKYARELHPDIVILGFGANDAKRVVTPHRKQVAAFRSRGLLGRLNSFFRHSSLYQTLKILLSPGRDTNAPPPAGLRSAVSQKRYRKNLSYMAGESFAFGAKNVLALALCTPGNYARTARRLTDGERILFLNGQAELLRILPRVKKKELYRDEVARLELLYSDELRQNDLLYLSSDGCHPNALGHRIIAERVAELLS